MTPRAEPAWARPWPYITIGLLLAILIAGASFYRQRQQQTDQGFSPPPSPQVTPTPGPDFVKWLIVYRPVPEIVEPIRWLAFALPFLWLLYEWYLDNRRKLLLSKLSSDYHPHVFPFRPDTPQPVIFTSERFYNLARRLRRRQATGLDLLDINSTVNSTIKFLGYPVLRFKSASKLPEYLALIERKSSRDTLSGFFDELVKTLEREGLHVTRYYYEGDPRICFKPSLLPIKTGALLEEVGVIQREQGVPLRDVLNEHEDCRLLIFGSGEGLVNPLTGDMEKWVGLFDDFKEKALFTPVAPHEWSFREQALANQFSLLPSTFDGLHALADYYETGEAVSLQRWVHKDRVYPSLDFDSTDIVSLLREHLGEDSFRWLCACAIYPSLQWNLMVYLGWLPSLRANLVDEQNILRLIRLPWFRVGSIPERLRQLLINELSPEFYNEAHAAIVEIINEPERARVTGADIFKQLNVAIPRNFRVLSEAISRRRTARPVGRIFRDYIFVRFLESKPNTLLDLVLPRSLSKVFYPHGNTALRMKFGLRILTILLVSGILWMAAPIIASAIKTEPTFTAQNITVPDSTSPPLTATPGVTGTPAADITPGVTPQPQPTPTAVSGRPETDQTPQLSSTPPSETIDSAPPTISTASTPIILTPTTQPTQPTAPVPPPPQGNTVGLSLNTGPVCPRVRVIRQDLPVFTAQNRIASTLRAEVTGGKILESPQYVWSLQYNNSPASNTQGSIIAGQGTSEVNTLWRVDTESSSRLITKVNITGYNVICDTNASLMIQTLKPDASGSSGSSGSSGGSGGCDCMSCGTLQCCPNPGYCLNCGSCGTVCCSGGEP